MIRELVDPAVSDEWAPQIISLLKSIGEIGFVGGGYARHALLSHKSDVPVPGDIDVFCTSEESYRHITLILEELSYVLRRALPHADEYGHDIYGHYTKVQVIRPHENDYIRMVGTPEEVLAQFDYTINMAAIQYENDAFVSVVGPYFETHNFTKILVINHCNAPLAMVTRAVKYAKKGYSISIKEVGRIFSTWDARPVEYRARINSAFQRFDAGEMLSDAEMSELYGFMRN